VFRSISLVVVSGRAYSSSTLTTTELETVPMLKQKKAGGNSVSGNRDPRIRQGTCTGPPLLWRGIRIVSLPPRAAFLLSSFPPFLLSSQPNTARLATAGSLYWSSDLVFGPSASLRSLICLTTPAAARTYPAAFQYFTFPLHRSHRYSSFLGKHR
jgi:hypothetical protein